MNRRQFLMCAGSAAACTRDTRPRLNVYNWSAYIDPASVRKFEQERGVRIRYGTFESNEEMLAKVVTGNSGWDIVFPTHSRLAPMARNKLLAPLDRRLLPHLENLDTLFQSPPWDPELRWGLPYMWNGTGIAWNRSVQPAPGDWDILWSDTLRGRVTMLDDPEDVIGACLLKLGLPFDSGKERELRAAQVEAVKQKRTLRAYVNAEVRDQLVAGDVLAAQLWSTTASQAIHAARRPVSLAFTYPRQGYPLYCDCGAILAESRRRELGHEFLAWLLRPDIAAANARVAETATANKAARSGLPFDDVLYPAPGQLALGIWPKAPGRESQRLRDRIWTEIKAS